MSPSARSTALLKKQGYLVANVEKFVRFPPPGHRVDMFGFVDLVAIRGNETLAVQVTDGTSVSKRIEKIKLIPAADHWLQSPTRRIEVHGWRKVGARGKRKKWECRIVEIRNMGNLGLVPVDDPNRFQPPAVSIGVEDDCAPD